MFTQTLTTLPLDIIEPGPMNPRRRFDQVALEELADSIRMMGIIEPIVVRPLGGEAPQSDRYAIIAGERRCRAARLADLDVVPVSVRECTEMQALEMTIAENLQRVDLDPIEEAEGLAKLAELAGITIEEVARRVNRSAPAVSNSIRLLKLPENARNYISDGTISAAAGRALVTIVDSAEKLEELLERAVSGELNSKDLERLVADYKRAEAARIQPQMEITAAAPADPVSREIGRVAPPPAGEPLALSGDGADVDADEEAAATEAVSGDGPGSAGPTGDDETPEPPAAAASAPVVDRMTETATPDAGASMPAAPAAAQVPDGQFVSVPIPVDLEDWLWEANLTAQTAIETLRRINTCAELKKLSLEAFVAELESE